jgi:hypothetical protein
LKPLLLFEPSGMLYGVFIAERCFDGHIVPDRTEQLALDLTWR